MFSLSLSLSSRRQYTTRPKLSACVPSPVCTQFKLQGRTLPKLVLSLGPRPVQPYPNMTAFYVLVSRVRSFAGLRLLERDEATLDGLTSTLQHHPYLRTWTSGYDKRGRWSDELARAAHAAGEKAREAAKAAAADAAKARREANRPVHVLRLPELQERCKAAKLDPVGTKALLIARLQAHGPAAAPSAMPKPPKPPPRRKPLKPPPPKPGQTARPTKPPPLGPLPSHARKQHRAPGAPDGGSSAGKRSNAPPEPGNLRARNFQTLRTLACGPRGGGYQCGKAAEAPPWLKEGAPLFLRARVVDFWQQGKATEPLFAWLKSLGFICARSSTAKQARAHHALARART